MKPYKRYSFVLIAVLVILSCGCFGPKAQRFATEFYTLHYDPPEKMTDTPMAFSISFEVFEAAPPYDSIRMIYTNGSTKLNYYSYHEWMTLPADMATFLLARDMRSADIVRAVLVDDERAATHRITGRIESFCEQNLDNEWNAFLSISITLLKINEMDALKQIILQKNYSVSEPCTEKNPTGLSEALSIAMSKISMEMIGDIQKVLLN
jgi:ABC-type uncharacterized transport system auxiliary subunit